LKDFVQLTLPTQIWPTDPVQHILLNTPYSTHPVQHILFNTSCSTHPVHLILNLYHSHKPGKKKSPGGQAGAPVIWGFVIGNSKKEMQGYDN
jgi:hypothetical protein